MSTFALTNLNYLFYSCTNLASITGLGNLANVSSMRYTFSSCAVTSLDFRSFDPSTLTDVFYCFSGYRSLVTIYADSTWTLPASGLTGSQCFLQLHVARGRQRDGVLKQQRELHVLPH